MFNDLDDVRPDRSLNRFLGSWFFWLIGAVVVLSIVSFGLRWASVPGEIVSPENVREQWTFAYNFEEDLEASARQICLAEDTLAASESENERTQRRSHLLAYQQNYTKIEANYNARLRNAFEAKLVKPSDVPDQAPTLEEMKQRVCPKIPANTAP